MKRLQRIILLTIILIISNCQCGIIKMQKGSIDLLDSNDEVIRLYKKIEFEEDFNEDENTLDKEMNIPNELNKIKCITSINSIGTSNTSNNGINLSISTTFITNHSFYLVYHTLNSPTIINSLTINWICFTSNTINIIDYKYKKGDSEIVRYSTQNKQQQGEKWQQDNISSGDSLKEYETIFMITGFELLSSQDISFNMDIISGSNEYFYSSLNALPSLQSLTGYILIAPITSCTHISNLKLIYTMNIDQNNTNNNNNNNNNNDNNKMITRDSRLNGEFVSFKAKDYGILYGINKIKWNIITNDEWEYRITDYNVEYKDGNISTDIILSQTNHNVVNSNKDKNSEINIQMQSIICEVEDAENADSNTDIIVGSLTIVFGIIIFLSTALLYIPKKKLHQQLQDDHDLHTIHNTIINSPQINLNDGQ